MSNLSLSDILQIVIAFGTIISCCSLIFQIVKQRKDIERSKKKEYCNAVLDSIRIIKRQKDYADYNLTYDYIRKCFSCYAIEKLKYLLSDSKFSSTDKIINLKNIINIVRQSCQKYVVPNRYKEFENNNIKLHLYKLTHLKSNTDIVKRISALLKQLDEYQKEIEKKVTGDSAEDYYNLIIQYINDQTIDLQTLTHYLEENIQSNIMIVNMKKILLDAYAKTQKLLEGSLENI